MKVKNVTLKWYVLDWNNSLNEVCNHNVLWSTLPEEIRKEIKKGKINNYKEFKEYITKEFKYKYWCRAECEFYIKPLFGEKEQKVDLYSQLLPNIDRICEYIINTMKIEFKGDK